MALVLSEKKEVIGDFNFSFPSHMNSGKVFLDRILNYGNKVAMVDGATNEQISFEEMAQKIANVAHSLVQLGVKEGEVVAICSENRIEFITTAMAVLYSGAVLTFLNSAYSRDDIVYIAEISKPKYVFLSPAAYDAHYKTLKDHNRIKQYFIFGNDKGRTDVICFEELAGKYVDMKHYKGANFCGRAHTALILYSSGTTGMPKGVKLTHPNYMTTAYQVTTTSRPLTLLNVAPFANTMGFFYATDSLIYGKTLVFLSRFSEDTYLRSIEKYKVGYCLVAPPTLITLCKSSSIDKYDLSSLEILFCGGAPLKTSTIDEVKTRFPNVHHILQVYGMTETSGAISRETDIAYKYGSVGKVVAGIIVKVVDIETRKTLGPRQQGELCVKGSGVFEGYIGKNMDEFLENDFFKTGDIGYYDEEGFIFIVGRLKELIKYKGWQVPPSELEAVLLTHPDVKDAAVVGTPDTEAGELPTAFIVKKPGSKVTGQEIVEFIHSKVSPWKRLRGGVLFVEGIPKNTSGKILRHILQKKLIKPASNL